MLLLFFTILLNSFFKEDKQQGPSFHHWNQHSWGLCASTRSHHAKWRQGEWCSDWVAVHLSPAPWINPPGNPSSLRAGRTILGSRWPGQARLKVSSKQIGSNLSNSLHLPSPAPFVLPLEENFNSFCIGKKKNTLFWLKNYQRLKVKSQLSL